MNINECLDERNINFFNSNIKNKENIILLHSGEEKVWRVNYITENQKIEILCGNNFPNVESFTHEILHVYLYQNGFNRINISNYPSVSVISKYITNSRTFFSEIENLIAHYKMAPIFTNVLKMDIRNFYADNNRFVTDDTMNDLLSKSNLHSTYIQHYLTLFFNCRYDMTNQYEEEYNGYTLELKKLNQNLYSNIENICLEWESDINDFDNIKFFNSLMQELHAIFNKLIIDKFNSY